MARSKTSNGGAKVTELQNLQKLVAKALTLELEQAIEAGEVNQAAVRNALQFLRDNDVVAMDDTINDADKLASLLPPLDLTEINLSSSRYAG